MPGNGSAELAALAARLKATGDKGLRLQLLRGLKAGAAPLIPAVREAATEQLPKQGGLNEYVAKQKITVSVRTGARTAGVRLVTTTPATEQTNSGFVRHPTFGRRGKGDWKVTETQAGWWSDTLAASAPVVTPQLLKVLEETAVAIQGGL